MTTLLFIGGIFSYRAFPKNKKAKEEVVFVSGFVEAFMLSSPSFADWPTNTNADNKLRRSLLLWAFFFIKNKRGKILLDPLFYKFYPQNTLDQSSYLFSYKSLYPLANGMNVNKNQNSSPLKTSNIMRFTSFLSLCCIKYFVVGRQCLANVSLSIFLPLSG